MRSPAGSSCGKSPERIEPNAIVLDQGSVPSTPTTLYVDCSADGLEKRPVKPVFAGNRVVLQSVRTCHQVFSAAFIGHVESAYEGDALKNELCAPVPHPDTDVDYLRTTLADLVNGARWSRDADLRAWLQNARLDGYSQPGAGGDASPESTETLAAVALAAAGKLQQMVAEVDR